MMNNFRLVHTGLAKLASTIMCIFGKIDGDLGERETSAGNEKGSTVEGYIFHENRESRIHACINAFRIYRNTHSDG